MNASSMEHAFACIGTYDSGAVESWHRSGRLYVGHESPNDTVAACRSSKTKARRHIERLCQMGKVKSCGSLQQPQYWVE